MLRFNKKLEYGIIALFHLASQDSKSASVREMAEVCHLPETLLSKIMQQMKAEGFVAAIHGNHGGYRLNRSLSEINLLDLTRTLVGPVQLAECLEPGNQCPVGSSCTLMTPMQQLNARVAKLFEGTSLESLIASRKVAL